jgi:hypothetical protein
MTVYHRRNFELVRDFSHDEATDGRERIPKRCLKLDLLVIDDKAMKQLPKRGGECLFEVIMRRRDVPGTMRTSNRPLGEWGNLIGDVPIATAILDRFTHHGEVFDITRRSLQMGNWGKNSTSTKAPTVRRPKTRNSIGTTGAKPGTLSPTGTVWGANARYCSGAN